ncbi:MAG: ABC transporter permease [Oscillospiraceae bacterium]|jgi:ABC-2 type transport system permease protein|nr:ABC transporter permease [Oscillospiraceae bacterium]
MGKLSLRFQWNNFMKYRFLLKEIVRKNVRLQYRESVLGMVWTLLQPLLFTLVLSFVFSILFNRSDVGGVPFLLYLMCGRLLFSFFTDSTKRAMRSVRQNAGIIKKVYVPRYIYPMGNVLSTFVTFLLSLIVLVGFIIYYDVCKGFTFGLHLRVLYAIVPIVILFVFSMGVGLLLASISVFFKDTDFIYDVLCNLLFYLSPIIYSPDDVMKGRASADLLLKILRLNPLYGIIQMFRNVVFYSPGLMETVKENGKNVLSEVAVMPFFYSERQLLYTAGLAVVVMALGAFVFYKQQDKFILHL